MNLVEKIKKIEIPKGMYIIIGLILSIVINFISLLFSINITTRHYAPELTKLTQTEYLITVWYFFYNTFTVFAIVALFTLIILLHYRKYRKYRSLDHKKKINMES